MSRRSFYILAVMLVAAFSFYCRLGSYGLLDKNEGLYAEIPREMLASGDFVIPHLNGVAYIEKPPLLYWLTALSYACFGVNEFAARLVPATAGFLTALILLVWLARCGNLECGLLAATIWSTSAGGILLGRVVLFDMLLTLLLVWAMLAFYTWNEGGRRRDLYQFWGALSLAVLTKGLLALALSLPAVGLFLLIEDRQAPPWSSTRLKSIRRAVGRMLDPWGVALFLLIALPWHIAATVRDSHFAWFYFVNEHVLRFLGLREPHDYHLDPWYHYLPLLLQLLLPWTVLIVAAAWPWPRREQAAPQKEEPNFTRFLSAWFGAGFLFLSLSSAKGDYYIIAVLPPAVMLAAQFLWARRAAFHLTLLPALVAFLALAMAFMAMLVTSGAAAALRWGPGPLPAALAPPLWGGTLLALAVLWLMGRWMPFKAVMSACILIEAGGLIAALDGFKVFENNISSKQMVVELPPDTQSSELYFYRRFEDRFSSAVFYRRKPIPIIDSDSKDLLYGQGTNPGAMFPSSTEVAAALRAAYVFVADKDVPRFARAFAQVPFVLVKDYERTKIFALCDQDTPFSHILEIALRANHRDCRGG